VVRRKPRFIGIIGRERTSPNTWRWWQHAGWTRDLPARAITNVSPHVYAQTYFLGGQPTVTRTFMPGSWSDESVR
jgi:hypothetical protein